MMVKSFLAWMDQAGPMDRAQAVDMLARAFLNRALGGDRPEEVEAALCSILDDPSVHVRKSLAMAFADRIEAPHAIVLSLAADQPQVGALLIARSPVLSEADLFELAFVVEGLSLVAIAMRQHVSARISQAIVSRHVFDAILALVRNPASEIATPDLIDIAQQFGQRHDLREALLARDSLPAVVRYILVALIARQLGGFAASGGFLAGSRGQRVVDDTLQSAILTIGEKHRDELPDLAHYLRLNSELTPALLLRSVLGGDLGFLAAALADLTGLELRRVQGLMHARTDAALSALMRRAELPGFLMRPLIGAIRAAHSVKSPRLSGFALPVIQAAQAACIDVDGEEGVRLLAVLRRYETDAARGESRRLAEMLRNEARAEFVQIAAQHEETRLLDDLSAEEVAGAIPPYEEIGFEQHEVSSTPLDLDEGLVASPEAVNPFRSRTGEGNALFEDWALRPAIGSTLADPVPAARIDEQEGRPSAAALRSLIAEWRREREEKDRANGLAAAGEPHWPSPANHAGSTSIETTRAA